MIVTTQTNGGENHNKIQDINCSLQGVSLSTLINGEWKTSGAICHIKPLFDCAGILAMSSPLEWYYASTYDISEHGRHIRY